MWTRKFSQVYKGLDKKRIWELWTDVNSWPTWHDDLDYCQLNGKFLVGNKFKLKPKGGPAVSITLTAISEGRSFTDLTKFPLAKMYDTHEIEETKDGLRLTNTVVVTGLLKHLWVKIVAQKVADSAEDELNSLVKLARSSND